MFFMETIRIISGLKKHMNNEITVYWTTYNSERLRSSEPIDLYKEYINKRSSMNIGLNMCPAFKGYMNNMFGLQSIFDYEFKINGNEFLLKNYNKDFFEKNVSVRSLQDKVFSFNQNHIFFTEEKNLEMSSGIQPFLEDNNINKRCIIIPGTMDIGKWFRPIDFAFVLKDEFDEFKIKEKEVFQYINFNTDSKINFKEFHMNEKLFYYKDLVVNAKSNRRVKIRSLNEYYSMFNIKKNVLKEIKENLVE
jgi:hypothetical protein